MWFFIALIVGAAIIGFAWWAANRKMGVRWYEWILGVLGVLMVLFTIKNVLDASAEQVTKAPGLMLLYTGVPALILLLVTWQLIIRHKKVTA